MKKKFHILCLLFFSALAAWQCASSRTAYTFPPYLAHLNQDSLVKQCNKGKVLYKENCSRCHGIFSKGKDGVPDFTKTQVEMYFEKIIMLNQVNHSILRKMPHENTEAIKNFLFYRKKG